MGNTRISRDPTITPSDRISVSLLARYPFKILAEIQAIRDSGNTSCTFARTYNSAYYSIRCTWSCNHDIEESGHRSTLRPSKAITVIYLTILCEQPARDSTRAARAIVRNRKIPPSLFDSSALWLFARLQHEVISLSLQFSYNCSVKWQSILYETKGQEGVRDVFFCLFFEKAVTRDRTYR